MVQRFCTLILQVSMYLFWSTPRFFFHYSYYISVWYVVSFPLVAMSREVGHELLNINCGQRENKLQVTIIIIFINLSINFFKLVDSLLFNESAGYFFSGWLILWLTCALIITITAVRTASTFITYFPLKSYVWRNHFKVGISPYDTVHHKSLLYAWKGLIRKGLLYYILYYMYYFISSFACCFCQGHFQYSTKMKLLCVLNFLHPLSLRRFLVQPVEMLQ